ncbi:hypothetical protein RJR36_00060 [Enterobacter asburiae]|nr:hypothetical protein [Enterobacter asburiae]
MISDEIHCDLSRSGIGQYTATSLFPDSTRIITCMSSSKTFNLAGNLLANIIIPDPGVRSEWRLRHNEFISPLSLAANKAAWSECDDWLVHLREYIDGNFQYLPLSQKLFTRNQVLDPRRDISHLDGLAATCPTPQVRIYRCILPGSGVLLGKGPAVCRQWGRIYPVKSGLPTEYADSRDEKNFTGTADTAPHRV